MIWPFNKIAERYAAWKTRPVEMLKLFVRTDITLYHNDGGKSVITLEKMRWEYASNNWAFYPSTHHEGDGVISYWAGETRVLLPLSNYKAVHVDTNEWSEKVTVPKGTHVEGISTVKREDITKPVPLNG